MNTENNRRLLAYRIYPLPNGTEYFEDAIKNERDVEDLFDYAQILELIIYKDGWDYLITTFGFDKLYEINQRSGWFDCISIDEFKLKVEKAKCWDK